MATWHQQRAGLHGLYDVPKRGYKVVHNPPNDCASAITVMRKRVALRLARKPYSTLIPAATAKPGRTIRVTRVIPLEECHDVADLLHDDPDWVPSFNGEDE